MEVSEQRQIAINAARYCKDSLNYSMAEFEEAVDMCAFADENVNDALWGLKSRGELEHLMQFVWTFVKEN
jgi:hypothetical protein